MPTAIEFFKLLPKTNCGECGNPTCLAFAMQLANQKAKLDQCPYVSDEAKAKLAASSAPPVRAITFGTGERKVEMGEETVLYRHEKRFLHPTAYALVVDDDGDVEERVALARSLSFERIGQMLEMDMLAVRNSSGDTVRFAEAARKVAGLTDLPLVLMSDFPEAMSAALEEVKGRALIHSATAENLDGMAALAKASGCPLALRCGSLDGMSELVEAARAKGVGDLVLDLEPEHLGEALERNTVARRSAIKRTAPTLGYPLMCVATGNERGMMVALTATMKYASIVVLEDIDAARALPLYVLRQNIYTDPQVPIQVKADLYPINSPDESSPIIFTTNFSLTYFTVSGDAEKSKMPVWLQVVDTEGLSVLTAFSAGKLTAESVVEALSGSSALDRSKGPIVIPGMVSRMSGKLAELTGREVVVGPRESNGLPKLLKNL
jgi:acetyl-CoA decarbonylase/synthase complex subunit gamma